MLVHKPWQYFWYNNLHDRPAALFIAVWSGTSSRMTTSMPLTGGGGSLGGLGSTARRLCLDLFLEGLALASYPLRAFSRSLAWATVEGKPSMIQPCSSLARLRRKRECLGWLKIRDSTTEHGHLVGLEAIWASLRINLYLKRCPKLMRSELCEFLKKHWIFFNHVSWCLYEI